MKKALFGFSILIQSIAIWFLIKHQGTDFVKFYSLELLVVFCFGLATTYYLRNE